MIGRMLNRLSGRIDPNVYSGLRAGLIPFDLSLSLLAKRSYGFYRTWYAYSELTRRYFERRNSAAATDASLLSRLRNDGFVTAPSGFSPAAVATAHQWVIDRADQCREEASRIDPTGLLQSVEWRSGAEQRQVDRRTGRVRMFFSAADPAQESWPTVVKRYFHEQRWRGLAQGHFNTEDIVAGVPYFMAEVLTQGPHLEPWHIDCLRPTLKAFLYLSDVGAEQGPLRYIPGTHVLDDERHHLFYRICNGGLGHAYFSEDENRRLDARGTSVCAPAGTVVAFDTQGLHSGSFCMSGMRVALVIGYRPVTALRLNPRLFRDPAPVPHPWERN